MARFSVCGGDDGEGSSNDRSRKRQRLPSIDEDEEDAEDSDAGSSGEEDEEQSLIPHRDEEGNCRGRRMESEDRASTSDDSSREVLLMEVERRFGNSVVNSQSSSSRDSPLSLMLLDPDVLDCPICYEALKIPIFQCDNGHVACSACCTKVRNRCPSCTLPIGYIRCRAMEKVIEASRVSCPNAKYGCKENMLYGSRFSHEKLCVFAPCSCPVRNCNYVGYHKDLNSHVRDKHKDDDVIPFVWDKSLSISFHVREDTTILQEENDGEVIVVKAFKGLHVVYVTVSCIAPSAPPGVGKLSCHLVNRAADSSLTQGFMVKNIGKVGNEQPEDGFVVIPSYMLAGDVLISIGRGRIFVHA
uniref:RING-type E3 ubiquitin transferase n=1 Tax=Noccaea caerulescens TaxID=107243 RepID=A0A1J3DUI3_NOCCA